MPAARAQRQMWLEQKIGGMIADARGDRLAEPQLIRDIIATVRTETLNDINRAVSDMARETLRMIRKRT